MSSWFPSITRCQQSMSQAMTVPGSWDNSHLTNNSTGAWVALAEAGLFHPHLLLYPKSQSAQENVVVTLCSS